MRNLSMRVRLTSWYFGIIAVTLCAFGVGGFFVMQKGIEATVDFGLRTQASKIAEFLGSLPPGDLLKERLDVDRLPRGIGGDFLQICDQYGLWIYRSPLMLQYDVPRHGPSGHVGYSLAVKRVPIRVFSSEIRIRGDSYSVQVAAPMDEFDEALGRFRWMILLLSPLLLSVASAGGYWMSGRALRPVDEIIREAESIDSKNLSKRLRITKSEDELQRLSKVLNGMLERLETAFNKIARFTADASHELRTPIAVMRTITEVSLRTSQTIAEHRDAETKVLEELEKTSSLVEKLMLLARADRGEDRLQYCPVDLASTVREACFEGEILAETKQITLEKNISREPFIVQGDFQRLRRLFVILIENAVKYTPTCGQVTISVGHTDGFATVEVKDTGIGIAPEDLPHIFDRFYRADKARSRDGGGLGLGLSIAQWEADAHGGSIVVQSVLGRGSAFQVRLPLLND